MFSELEAPHLHQVDDNATPRPSTRITAEGHGEPLVRFSGPGRCLASARHFRNAHETPAAASETKIKSSKGVETVITNRAAIRGEFIPVQENFDGCKAGSVVGKLLLPTQPLLGLTVLWHLSTILRRSHQSVRRLPQPIFSARHFGSYHACPSFPLTTT